MSEALRERKSLVTKDGVLKVGDAVKLRSGGNEGMTIVSISPDGPDGEVMLLVRTASGKMQLVGLKPSDGSG